MRCNFHWLQSLQWQLVEVVKVGQVDQVKVMEKKEWG